MWSSPIKLRLIPTTDSYSFQAIPSGWTGLPILPHPGAFGFVRKHHSHEGVDLYCPEGTPVFAVETGRVTRVMDFTGAAVNSPWWHDTKAVAVHGNTGIVIYGEIDIANNITEGKTVYRGDLIGYVKQVLRKDKGRPMSMLHLELHDPDYPLETEWVDRKPQGLRDPTPHLMDAAMRQTSGKGFIKAGLELIPVDLVDKVVICANTTAVNIHLVTGRELVARGIDAIEVVCTIKPSAWEGDTRLRWKKGVWWFHNLIAHPLMQVLAWCGFGRLGVKLHDISTPTPRDWR